MPNDLPQNMARPCITPTAEELLSDEALDAIYVSTPVYLHCEQVIAAAEEGFHVLCDKPMAMNTAECRRMIDACQANGVHLQICFLFRFHSCFQQIKNWVAAGHLGQIVQGRAPFLKPFPIPTGAWRGDPDQGGGGSLMDLGAHGVDLLRYIVGEISHVSAFCNSVVHGYDVEETGTVMLRFENGAQGFVDTSFAAAGCDLVLEIYGTDGWVWVYNDDGWKIKLSTNGDSQVIDSPFEDLYQYQFEHFARCVSDGEAPIVTGIDGSADQSDPCSGLRIRSDGADRLVFSGLGRVDILVLLMPIYRHPRRVGIGKQCNHRGIWRM